MAVTVWNHDRGSDPKSTAYLTDVLNSIGLKAKEKVINSAVYWTTVGNQATKAQIGFADWFQDYPHPLDWFDVLLNGERITQTHNNNYANFDDKSVNSQIDSLKKEPVLDNKVERSLGDDRQGSHAAGSVGAVPQPAVHGLLQFEHRPELLHQSRAVPVRLLDDLQEVVEVGWR